MNEQSFYVSPMCADLQLTGSQSFKKERRFPRLLLGNHLTNPAFSAGCDPLGTSCDSVGSFDFGRSAKPIYLSFSTIDIYLLYLCTFIFLAVETPVEKNNGLLTSFESSAKSLKSVFFQKYQCKC